MVDQDIPPPQDTLESDLVNSFRAWESGISRTIQRVVAGLIAFYAVVVATWIPVERTSTDVSITILLLCGVAVLAFIISRAWRGRVTMTDVALAWTAMTVGLNVDAAVGTDGIGISGGPAYVFMTTTLLLAALTQRWQRFWAVALLTTAVYVTGRAIAGGHDHLWSSLDEVVSDTSTIAAAGLIMVFYRRAGMRADAALRVRLEMGRREAGAAARERVASDDRRLLHDEVISALVAIAHCGAGGDSSRAVQVAQRGLDALEHQPSNEPSLSDPLHLVDTEHV